MDIATYTVQPYGVIHNFVNSHKKIVSNPSYTRHAPVVYPPPSPNKYVKPNCYKSNKSIVTYNVDL